MTGVTIEIEIDPLNGVTGYPIGMPVDELVPAAVSQGRVVIHDPDLAGLLHFMKVDLTVYLERSGSATVFGFEDARTLTWIELYAPRPLAGRDGIAPQSEPEMRVSWRGIDVFGTPALELLDQVEAQGYEIDRSEAPLRYTIPALELCFARVAGDPDAPRARDGQARFIQSVLVAGRGYFEQPLPEIDFGALAPKPLVRRFEIDPPDGLAGFPFGMPLEELIAAATPLGHVRLDDPGHAGPGLYTKLHLTRPSFAAIFACEDGQSLTAVELWAPTDSDRDRITVELRGIDGVDGIHAIDMFATPALEIIDRLTSRGYALDNADPDYPRFPELAIGFTRTRGHDVPLAPDGRPRYFQAVLAGPAGYYDRRLPSTELEGGEPWKSRLTRPRAAN